MLILDRFEEDMAYIEGENGAFSIPRERISPDVREGDVLAECGGLYCRDEAATAERRRKMRSRLKRLTQ